ncbi:MAG TPA: hypothetical protein VJ867_14210 [Gemmatimonadaceae bacterium]|nr:hypothetical protein [Gemmatimonadaceae bacterium]
MITARTSTRSVAAFSAAVIAAVLAACDWPTPPRNARLYAPPIVYARWWKMTEECSGRTARLADLKWYRTPGAVVTLHGKQVAGYWASNGNFIVVAEDYMKFGRVVRHEMLHALVRQGGHPREDFLEKCAAIVDCPAECVAEAGTWTPPPEFVDAPPESFTLSQEITLRDRESDGDRFLELRVRALNAHDSTLRLVVPDFPEFTPTFRYLLFGPSGAVSNDVRANDPSQLFFAAGQAKEVLFDFPVSDTLTPRSVTTGEILVSGGFGTRWLPSQGVSVTH